MLKGKHWSQLHYAGQSGIVHTEFPHIAQALEDQLNAEPLEPIEIRYPERKVKMFRYKVEDLARAYELMRQLIIYH